MRKLREFLYQGDISDLNVLKVSNSKGITMAINVGSTLFTPPNVAVAIHFPMLDSERQPDNNWNRMFDLVMLAVEEIKRGGKILVTCDAGFSRSITFTGMLLAVYEMCEMDDKLMAAIRHPFEDPLPGLWANARQYLESRR